MIEERTWPAPMTLLVALGGPTLAGAVVGIHFGALAIISHAVTLPAMMVALALLMAPALYIGLTLIGEAPPASQVARAMMRGFRSAGLVLAGLAPASAFLVATAVRGMVGYGVGAAMVGIAALVAVRRVFCELYPTGSQRGWLVFLGWTVVLLALGAQLLASSWFWLAPGDEIW